MQYFSLLNLWRQEFAGYNSVRFRHDTWAGLQVGLVVLPIALAFGVASGTTASAGLVTSILAGLLIAALSGTPLQISGATGAVSIITLLLSQQYGVEGVWIVGIGSGLLILLLGLLRLGRILGFIPAAVIAGITSGIALHIFVGQINNLLGSSSPAVEWSLFQWLTQFLSDESPLLKLLSYLQFNYAIDWQSLVIGAIVIAAMLFWPAQWSKYVPGSFAGILLATVVAWIANFDIPLIDTLPRTILLEERLQFSQIQWGHIQALIAPILSLTLLSIISMLQSEIIVSKASGVPRQANREFIAQGIGNIIIPFFGGIPASAAITPTSVSVQSGGSTRVVSFIHALALLLIIFIFAPLIALIPLAALAGLLMVIAWRMNDWKVIQSIFQYRLQNGLLVFTITLLATISFNLNWAIIGSVMIASLVIINRLTQQQIDIQKIDTNQLKKRGIALKTPLKAVRIAHLTGPLFFTTYSQFNETFPIQDEEIHTFILSMRNVALIDDAGMEALRFLHQELEKDKKTLLLCDVKPEVMKLLEQAGLDEVIGKKSFYITADLAIIEADKRGSKHPTQEQEPNWNGTTALALYRPAQPSKEKGAKRKK